MQSKSSFHLLQSSNPLQQMPLSKPYGFHGKKLVGGVTWVEVDSKQDTSLIKQAWYTKCIPSPMQGQAKLSFSSFSSETTEDEAALPCPALLVLKAEEFSAFRTRSACPTIASKPKKQPRPRKHFASFTMAELEAPNGFVKRIVDLRSDTVTTPTPAMREAMASAEVDDDVLGVDPTVDRLQKQLAQICGKEAGLFVPSGSMGNLISVLVHCEVRGSEAIIGSESHIHLYEQGGISTLGNVYSHILPNEEDGTIDVGKIEAAIRQDDIHSPKTRVICIENTHANSGGRCISPEYTDEVGALARRYGAKLHIDGARIFNAAAALEISVGRLVQAADSISVCLSKGLGAPIGSVIVASSEFIAKARRLRKALGGGMRQLGVLAAPALISLSDIAGKLHVDHENARLLADGINHNAKGLHVDLSSVQTNMVFIEVTKESTLTAAEICKALKNRGILVMALHKHIIRAVLHHQISQEDIQHAINHFQDLATNSTISNGNM